MYLGEQKLQSWMYLSEQKLQLWMCLLLPAVLSSTRLGWQHVLIAHYFSNAQEGMKGQTEHYLVQCCVMRT